MRVAIATDHAGFPLRDSVIQKISDLGHEILDLGANILEPEDDYPDFAQAAGQAIQRGEVARAVLLCGSGVGACIAANKVAGVRAAVCHDTYSARQGVQHDELNVLCLGGRVIGQELALEIVEAFLGATFSGEARHIRRLEKIRAMETHGFSATEEKKGA